jgi:LacI family transcriptional regulator
MQKQDYELLKNIQKPMIITDNDFEDNFHHRVCIDNISAVRLAVEYLLKRKCRKIVYLANEIEIFNFLQRREGFLSALAAHNLTYNPDMMVTLGNTNETVSAKKSTAGCVRYGKLSGVHRSYKSDEFAGNLHTGGYFSDRSG